MDQISDLLTSIRNAQAVLKEMVSVPMSNMNYGIAKILEKEGFIKKTEKKGKKSKKNLEIFLKYEEGVSAISGLKRISSPGQRIYINYKAIRPVRDGYGMSIISTPNGLLTNKEAKKQKVGGELICEIW